VVTESVFDLLPFRFEHTIGNKESIMKDIGMTASIRPRSRWRVITFYFAAVAVVLSPLVFVELVLRFLVSPLPIDRTDPYVSFHSLSPLFVLDSTGERFETAPERLEYFYPQSFPAKKGTKTFRIFCLGGSTVQGRPYAVETSFTTWLKLNIDASRSERAYEVVNCGGVSYASYRLVPVMQELLKYEPDLFIIYSGHNEFLEDWSCRRRRYHELGAEQHR